MLNGITPVRSKCQSNVSEDAGCFAAPGLRAVRDSQPSLGAGRPVWCDSFFPEVFCELHKFNVRKFQDCFLSVHLAKLSQLISRDVKEPELVLKELSLNPTF